MALSKEVALEKVEQAKTFALEKWDAFRAESRFFQAKVGIVASYVVICLLTLALVPPSKEPWRIEQGRIPMGLSFESYLELKNKRAGDLKGINVEVNGYTVEFDGRKVPGSWTSHPFDLPEGEKQRLFPKDLKNGKGDTPSKSLVIDNIRILDDDKEQLLQAVPVMVKE